MSKTMLYIVAGGIIMEWPIQEARKLLNEVQENKLPMACRKFNHKEGVLHLYGDEQWVEL